MDKGFTASVALKAALYAAEACRLVAADLGKDKEVGPQIARLQQGLIPLSRELKASKGAVPDKLWAAASATEAEMKRLLGAAERDNECVYMMRVPAAESLPALAGALLVKPAPMAPVLDAGKEKLLRSIVPDDSAKALSKYSEMVDELIRNEAASLTSASDAARIRLRELELPGASCTRGGLARFASYPLLTRRVTSPFRHLRGVLFSPHEPHTHPSSPPPPEEMLEAALAAPSQLPPLPVALAADVSEYHQTGGFRGLQKSVADFAEMAAACSAALDEVDGMLEHEAAEDEAARAEFGDAWTRAPSAAIAVALEERLEGYRQNIGQASQSDAYRAQRVNAMEGLLAALSPQALVANAPKLQPAGSGSGADDGKALVVSLCAQVQEMERLAGERAGLEELLKGMKAEDDILQKLMAVSSSGHEALFQQELQKCVVCRFDLKRFLCPPIMRLSLLCVALLACIEAPGR